ncbi:MAG: ORF6N domain-containing protein [Rickettsiales bacterium]|jgi:phage regulator Rha-like protein|nr:ORF6N domain-containing protein [Rickettsiales bacterium]
MKKEVKILDKNINKIYTIRGVQVMLDSDLAELYEIETKKLNQAVKRNLHRFPTDFMFQLDKDDLENLRFQFGTSGSGNLRSQFVTSGYGGRRYMPYVFTEHGVTMLSAVLNSERAVQVNLAVIRAFVAMRHHFAKPLVQKIDDLERVLMLHIDDTNNNIEQHAVSINEIIEALNNLINKPEPPRRKIGFI